MQLLRVLPDDSAQIARDRREVLKQRTLLAAVIAMFLVQILIVVFAMLLGLTVIIWILEYINLNVTHLTGTSNVISSNSPAHSFRVGAVRVIDFGTLFLLNNTLIPTHLHKGF